MRFTRTWAVCLSLAAFAFVALAAPAFAQSRQQQQQPRVYLLRGLANIFSLGMDDLAAKLNARGIKASVHSYVDVQNLSNFAVQEASEGRGRRRPSPVIIIGHSLGADAAVQMGNKVSAAGVPVPLVVTFDPVSANTASAKIGKVVNYYQAGGSGKPVSGPRVENVDLTRTGALTHFNIDKADDLHQRVISMIQRPARPAVRRPRPEVSAPAQAPAPSPVRSGAAPANTGTSTALPTSGATSSGVSTGTTETAAAPGLTPPAGVGTSN